MKTAMAEDDTVEVRDKRALGGLEGLSRGALSKGKNMCYKSLSKRHKPTRLENRRAIQRNQALIGLTKPLNIFRAVRGLLALLVLAKL
jgi:hypothetical protein